MQIIAYVVLGFFLAMYLYVNRNARRTRKELLRRLSAFPVPATVEQFGAGLDEEDVEGALTRLGDDGLIDCTHRRDPDDFEKFIWLYRITEAGRRKVTASPRRSRAL